MASLSLFCLGLKGTAAAAGSTRAHSTLLCSPLVIEEEKSTAATAVFNVVLLSKQLLHSSAERLQKIRSGVLATAEVDCIKGGHRRVPPTTGATGKEGLRAKAVQRVARVLGDVVWNLCNFIHVVRYALGHLHLGQHVLRVLHVDARVAAGVEVGGAGAARQRKGSGRTGGRNEDARRLNGVV